VPFASSQTFEPAGGQTTAPGASTQPRTPPPQDIGRHAPPREHRHGPMHSLVMPLRNCRATYGLLRARTRVNSEVRIDEKPPAGARDRTPPHFRLRDDTQRHPTWIGRPLSSTAANAAVQCGADPNLTTHGGALRTSRHAIYDASGPYR